MKDLVAVSHTMCVHVQGPIKLCGCWVSPLAMGHDSPRNMWLPTCYHAKFGHSRSNCMCIRRAQKVWGCWSSTPVIGVWLSPWKYVPPRRVTVPNLVVLGQTIRA